MTFFYYQQNLTYNMKHLKYFEDVDFDNEHDIKTIVDNYCITALFTEEVQNKGDEVDEFEGKTIYDFDKDSIDNITTEVEWFISAAGDSLEDLSDDVIGSDLWYTRNGHGVGFFDRGLDDNNLEDIEGLCKILGDSYIYTKKNGEIEYQSSKKYQSINLVEYKKKKELEKISKKFNV